MSYTEHVSGSVSYQRTVSIRYPASESGGTVSETVYGDIPVDISVHVDTRAFDSSVNSCNNSVKGLAVSLSAMEAAQVASLIQSGKEISKHVTDGFFNMINSELSQNNAQLMSVMNAKVGQILERSQALQNLHNEMETDYSRIVRRYNEIFNQLDEEERRSIVALDKKSFQLSQDIIQKQLCETSGKKTAFSWMEINDSAIIDRQLSVAGMNDKVRVVMESIKDYLISSHVYADKVSAVLFDEDEKGNKKIYLPVVYSETENQENAGVKSYDCYVSHKCSSNEKIGERVKDFFSTTKVSSDMDDEENEKKLIDSSFSNMAENYLMENGKDDLVTKRIYEKILELKKSNDLQLG